MSLDPPLDRALHLRHFKRCLSLLSHHYTGNDSTRMTLGCFILAAVDMLSLPDADDDDPTPLPDAPLVTPEARANYRRWVLSCQHARGGFCGSTTHVLPGEDQETDSGNANIAATYFALQLLALTADDGAVEGGRVLEGVDRARTLGWLRGLQRGDGSFGENLAELPGGAYTERGHVVAGGRDMRYCYLAAAIRWVLRGNVGRESPLWVEDIDVDAMVKHVRNSQKYDGGIAESPSSESHSGYGYCAVAALSLLDRPAEGTGTLGAVHDSKILKEGIQDVPALVRFLALRQAAYAEVATPEGSARPGECPEEEEDHHHDAEEARHIGFNGRCNKDVDTCYCWWVSASLSILHPHSRDNILAPTVPAQRRFLLEKTQHAIAGGFGKYPGSPPDLYHAYMGLVALAAMGEPNLKKIDLAMCISEDTVKRLEAGRRGLLGAAGKSGKA